MIGIDGKERGNLIHIGGTHWLVVLFAVARKLTQQPIPHRVRNPLPTVEDDETVEYTT